MSFTRVNPLGWAINDPLTSAQMNQLDINVSQAVDGSGGGTVAPSSPININGAGFSSDNILSSTVAAGETITLAGDGSAGGELDVRGLLSRFLSGAGTAGSGGRLPWRFDQSTISAASGNVTIRRGNLTGGIADIYVNRVDLSGDRTITLGQSGSQNGEIVVIVSWHSNNNMIIHSENGNNNPIATITDNAITGFLWVACVFDTNIAPQDEWVPFMRGDETEVTVPAAYPS